MRQSEPRSLREALSGAAAPGGRTLWGAQASAPLEAIAAGTTLGDGAADLAGASVVVATRGQLAAALAIIELDGHARRIVLCPPDLPSQHLASIVGDAGADAIVTDRDAAEFCGFDAPRIVSCGLAIRPAEARSSFSTPTEWVLLTSGTTGVPKMVVHSLAALTGAIAQAMPGERPIVWGTFYDIRRYGGLQIFLRAVMGGACLVLSEAGEPIGDHLHRLGARGVTHISGTPSHWRRALMCSECGAISPRYVRLSGEIADQAILDALKRQYPQAAIGHAYASTEAGVGFEVDDGREGFPAELTEAKGDLRIKIVDGSLRIRSPRTASRYVGSAPAPLMDGDGFVDTGDLVEQRSNRYYFVGRRGGIINVGGSKVHPEEVEQVINRHRSVKMSLVSARRSPITGAIVVADVILNDAAMGGDAPGEALKQDILAFCRASLPSHKIPAVIRFVGALELTAAGKLVRQNA
jgi:acyl-coenzyme A synthetase/AMP-(fatty) acid ligase